jgi:hypothetical protein
MKALTREYREQRHAEAETIRAANKYAREEDRLSAERTATITGTRMATQLSGPALARTFA